MLLNFNLQKCSSKFDSMGGGLTFAVRIFLSSACIYTCNESLLRLVFNAEARIPVYIISLCPKEKLLA